MTGIERLRGIVRELGDISFCYDLYARLGDIADQIEREARAPFSRVRVLAVVSDMESRVSDEGGSFGALVARWARELRGATLSRRESDAVADVSVSAYDLLPEDDREAVAWVRDHGGIAYVKDAWNVRSNLDRQLERAQAKVERQQRHIEHVQGVCKTRAHRIMELNKLNRSYVYALNGVCEHLGLTDGTGLPDMPEVIWTELDRRLVPEGMEWPRFEDGEPVRIGDGVSVAVHDEDGDFERSMTADSISFGEHGIIVCDPRHLVRLLSGERVRRPAPKVLDADGAEILVGDTVYDTELANGDKFTVESIDKNGDVRARGDKYILTQSSVAFTHRAPVLAADGKPLCEGEHVWHVETGTELVVKELPKPGAYQAVVVFAPPASHLTSFDPDRLTHERPDSWERLEEDVAGASCPDVYCANHHIDASDTSYEWAMARDIVRRAKALAERDA